MEATISDASVMLGVSARQLRRLAESGVIVGRSVAGRRVVSTRSVLAASRSRTRGRRWNAVTTLAALDLLATGATERIDGSSRSRLRGRLRSVDAAELAANVLADRVTIWRGGSGTSSAPRGLTALGSGITVDVVDDAAQHARRSRLVADADGDRIVVELGTDAQEIVETIARYAYGDKRTSSAARASLDALVAALR